MNKKIALLAGDGIGPEITNQTVRVLDKISSKFKHQFDYQQGLIGAIAIDKTGSPLPAKTLSLCKKCDAVFLAAVGDPKYADPSLKVRPEQGLLKLRSQLKLYANFRPVKIFKALINTSTIKPEVLKGVDFVVLRELTSGIYFGVPRGRRNSGKTAYDTCLYTQKQVEQIAHLAFQIALKRKKRVTSIDKANVLETSRLWRETVIKVSKKYPKVALNHYYVDIAALSLVKNPSAFDVIVTTNMFGDILSDESAVLAGSLGMMPSASFSKKGVHLYEPIHGSAPKYKGLNKVNPIASILSAALMLRYSFSLEKEAKAIEKAVEKTLDQGFRTYDIMEKKCQLVSTSQMTDQIIKNII